MNTNNLYHQLYTINAIRFREFILKSGVRSPIDINLQQIIGYPQILRAVANKIWQQVADFDIKLICGVAYTALPIATCIALEHNIPMVMCRKENKDHGIHKRVAGVFTPGQHCLIIEDIITTASSVLETVHTLQQEGLIVHHVAAFLNRQQGGKHVLRNKGIQMHAVITLQDFLLELQQCCSSQDLPFIRKLTEEIQVEKMV